MTESSKDSSLCPRDQALEDLDKVCEGLRKEFGNIFIGMSFHPILKRQIDQCNRMGISRDSVDKIVNGYRR